MYHCRSKLSIPKRLRIDHRRQNINNLKSSPISLLFTSSQYILSLVFVKIYNSSGICPAEINISLTMKLFCGILFLLTCGVSSILVSQKLQYKDLDRAPANLSKIETHHSSTTLLDCLLKCSKNKACKSVVHQGTTCHLYDTDDGTEVLIPGQKAVAEIARDSKYGKLFYIYIYIYIHTLFI